MKAVIETKAPHQPLESFLRDRDAPVFFYIGLEALGDDLTKENLLQRTLEAMKKTPEHMVEISLLSTLLFTDMNCGGCPSTQGLRNHVMHIVAAFEAEQQNLIRGR
jgi:hypothetical protein